MKLNNKGMTLVELIISVALLSVVLGFLFKVLLDVKYESDDAGFAIASQVNRAEIIKEIQNDLIDANGINNFYIDNDKHKLSLHFDDGVKYLDITDNKTLTYDNKKWTIKDENYQFGDMSIDVMHSCFVKVTIPIFSYLDEDGEDALIDDIEIFTRYKGCLDEDY